jgi:hypothetical protein
MSQQTEGPNKTFEADGSVAMPQYSRVTVTAGVLALAGVGVRGIGIIQEPVYANGLKQHIAVRLWNAPGSFKMIAAGAVVLDANVYAAASGKMDDAAGVVLLGKALETASGNNSIIEVLPVAEQVAPVAGVASGYKVARGQHTTVAASDTIVTGLATVVAIVAQLDDDPVDGCMHVTSSIGDQAGAPAAGSALIKTWRSTDGDATLIAANTFAKKVNWVAFGT